MHPYHHALSSVKKFGGDPEDYLPIHHWFDATKEHFADFRHRALRHHSQGIFECEQVFGVTLRNSAGQTIPTRAIGEQHVREDMGFIPTVKDYLVHIQAQDWMHRSPADNGINEAQLTTKKVNSSQKIELQTLIKKEDKPDGEPIHDTPAGA